MAVINLASRHVIAPINVGGNPFQIAITPDSALAYVAIGSGGVPIRPSDGKRLPAIPADRAVHIARVGTFPGSLAITPSLVSNCQPGAG